MKNKLTLALSAVLIFIFANTAFAEIGVGVGTGKIFVDEKLKPGVVYDLPAVSVLNTGDEASEYEITTEFRENQPEKKFDTSWINYNPNSFYLEPNDSQQVSVTLTIPLNAEPGDYFAFLSAHPKIDSGAGNTTVGIAAASKLYFTIEPANAISGIYYRVRSLWVNNQPWTNIFAGAIVLFIIFKTGSKYLNVDINIGKKKSQKDKEKDDE